MFMVNDTVPAVSVIIPAWNAASTLAATLHCVSAQTLRPIEIVLIDDGSTDDTLRVAHAHAQRDPRLRVFTQQNAGVADARNAALARARAPFVAGIDADDLWHPTFLEKLARALCAAGDDAVFAYANFRAVDARDQVLWSGPRYALSGRVQHRVVLANVVGNGSGLLARRDALLQIGGYERRLQHEFAAQGCEDWLVQARLAALGAVVAVPEYLVGYRQLPDAMSRDDRRMNRSWQHALQLYLGEHPELDPSVVAWAMGAVVAERAVLDLRDGQYAAGLRGVRRAFELDPQGARDAFGYAFAQQCYRLARRPVRAVWRRYAASLRREPPGKLFADCDPLADGRPVPCDLLHARIALAAGADEAVAREAASAAELARTRSA